MTLIDDLIAAGRDAAIAAAADPAWVADLTARARPLVADRLDGGWRSAAEVALDALDAHADAVAHLGAQGLVGLTAAWDTSGPAGAQEAYLRHHATVAELLDAADALDGEALAAGGGVTWADVADVLEAVAGALPAVLPLLLAVV